MTDLQQQPYHVPTVAWMEEWFDRFNHDYFDGKLPRPRFRLSRARTRMGTMSCKRRRRLMRTELYDFAIALSTYYRQTERQLQNTLLHEMIHYAIAYTGLRDTAPHGIVFRGMMDNLNRKYGWDITVRVHAKEAMMPTRKPTNRQFVVLALTLDTGEHMLSSVNPRYVQSIEHQIRRIHAVKEHAWYTSTDEYFAAFSMVRSLRGRKVTPTLFAEKIAAMKPLSR